MAGAVGAYSGVSKIKGGRWTVAKFFLLGVCHPAIGPSSAAQYGMHALFSIPLRTLPVTHPACPRCIRNQPPSNYRPADRAGRLHHRLDVLLQRAWVLQVAVWPVDLAPGTPRRYMTAEAVKTV